MGFPKSVKNTAFAVYLAFQAFSLLFIQFPKVLSFDEFHYVPSAKQFLALTQNQNWEHPPLGKLLIAAGIALWGDQPIGWRFASTLFGSLTLAGMYLLAWIFFANAEAALWVALLTAVNQLLYVQARIGMLDTFMVAFLIWGLVGFCATWNPKLKRKEALRWLTLSGLMFGLSIACKWFAIVPWIGCLGLVVVVKILQAWNTSFGHPQLDDWYRPDLWKPIRKKDWLILLGALPVLGYFLTFIPFFFVPGTINSPLDLIQMQVRMWEGQLRVVHSHPYMSSWWEWPLITRPIWYSFEREGQAEAFVRGVLLVGNPLIMWSGLLAFGVCVWDWFLHRKRIPFLITFFFSLFYFCWIVIPRKISFYYYYFPAGLILSFALAYVFYESKTTQVLHKAWVRWTFLGLASLLFLYFFPILAGLRIPAGAFRTWMWSQRWI